jgi:hypothetical protein
MAELTIGTFMQPLVESATQRFADILCRAHFFRYRRDVISESWEAQGKLTVDTELVDSGNPWMSPLIQTVAVRGALDEQFTALPPYATHPEPLSPMRIDVRYPALVMTGTPTNDAEQKVDISVDSNAVTAQLHNPDASIIPLDYQTHSGVIIAALWFDSGYDWFWLEFENVSRIMVPIDRLQEFFKGIYEGGGKVGATQEASG